MWVTTERSYRLIQTPFKSAKNYRKGRQPYFSNIFKKHLHFIKFGSVTLQEAAPTLYFCNIVKKTCILLNLVQWHHRKGRQPYCGKCTAQQSISLWEGCNQEHLFGLASWNFGHLLLMDLVSNTTLFIDGSSGGGEDIGVLDTPPPLDQKFFIFIQFSGKKWSYRRLAPPPLATGTLSETSWICQCFKLYFTINYFLN